MADKKQTEFTVTDKRRFTSEGEAAPAPAEQPTSEESQPPAAESRSDKGEAAAGPTGQPVPPPPSAEQRQAQHDAFKEVSKQLDDALAGQMAPGRSAKDFEVTFERFAASLYMSALVQLGLVHEQGGQPQVDLIGARQTIDTLGMIADKTKGNLTAQEENLLQNCLYELRMAYVDVTNMLTKPPEGGMPPMPGKK